MKKYKISFCGEVIIHAENEADAFEIFDNGITSETFSECDTYDHYIRELEEDEED